MTKKIPYLSIFGDMFEFDLPLLYSYQNGEWRAFKLKIENGMIVSWKQVGETSGLTALVGIKELKEWRDEMVEEDLFIQIIKG